MGSVGSSARLTGLDALRGLAVLLMIEQHVGIWLWQGPAPGSDRLDYPVLVAFNAMGGFGAPLFFSLAGIGSALLIARGQTSDGARLDRIGVKRGLLVMGFGYLLNVTTPSWFSWGSWFALHLMGFGMALAPVWRRLTDRGLLVAIMLVMAGAPLGQTWLQTPDEMTIDRLRDVGLAGGALRLALVEGQYPVLPWLAVYLAGFWSGRRIAVGRAAPIARLAMLGLSVGAIGWGVRQAWGEGAPEVFARAFGLKLGFFPPSVAMVALMGGGALLVVAAVMHLERRPLADDHPMVTLGRASLTIFLLHVWLFRELSRPVGIWSALAAGPTLAVIAGFIVISAIATRHWRRVGYRGGAEWLLRRLAH